MSQEVEAIRHELTTLRKIAKFAMPDLVADIDAALKALPKLEASRSLASRAFVGGSGLIHYPSLRKLVKP